MDVADARTQTDSGIDDLAVASLDARVGQLLLRQLGAGPEQNLTHAPRIHRVRRDHAERLRGQLGDGGESGIGIGVVLHGGRISSGARIANAFGEVLPRWCAGIEAARMRIEVAGGVVAVCYIVNIIALFQ